MPLEIVVVDRADHVGAADVQDLVAALELLIVVEVGSWSCSIVPIAPSAITTRCRERREQVLRALWSHRALDVGRGWVRLR